jgi:hypothetical protein
MVAVAALMAVLVVLCIICVVGLSEVMAHVAGAVVMLMLVDMRPHRFCTQVSIQAGRRRPGELERDDEHDDQGNEAAHGWDSTQLATATKGSFIPWRAGRHHSADAGKVSSNRVAWFADATLIEPPCASMMDLTMASPSPAPSPLR